MHTVVPLRLSCPVRDFSYTELFGAALPVYEDEYDAEVDEAVTCHRVDGDSLKTAFVVFPTSGGETQINGYEDFCRDDWEWLQEYGDISASLSEKGELYECVDINDICGNLGVHIDTAVVVDEEGDGPTLAELNDGARSPVVNPDMERLHFVALKTDVEVVSGDEKSHYKERGYVRSPWVDKSLRATSWLNSNVRTDETTDQQAAKINTPRGVGDAEPPNHGSTTTEDTKEEKQCRVEEENARDFDRHVEAKESNVADNNNVTSKANCVAGGNDNTSQYREEFDDSSDGSHDTMHGNSDSEMEDENFDSDNDDDDDMDGIAGGDDASSRNGGRKGRRKESEDGVPNPKRLLEIGRQLEKLNTAISELKPVHLLPVLARSQTRREKNKLASRACRLKKKATHEANKIKLRGLAFEKDRLQCSIRDVKGFVFKSTCRGSGKPTKYEKYEEVEKLLTGLQVAGNLHKFVESVLKSATGGSFNCATIF